LRFYAPDGQGGERRWSAGGVMWGAVTLAWARSPCAPPSLLSAHMRAAHSGGAAGGEGGEAPQGAAPGGVGAVLGGRRACGRAHMRARCSDGTLHAQQAAAAGYCLGCTMEGRKCVRTCTRACVCVHVCVRVCACVRACAYARVHACVRGAG